MAFGVQTDPDDYGILVGSAAPFSRPMTDASKLGVVELDQAAQLVLGIAFGHRPLNLMVQ